MKSLTTVMITGANGQLGKSIISVLEGEDGFKLINIDLDTLDITDNQAVFNAIEQYKPDFLVNTAAYTAVDNAEEDGEKAFLVNEKGVENLALACKNTNTVLIHLSTDYVYHSMGQELLNEASPTNPQGIYARSKLAGEKKLIRILENYYIIRTSWLYSEYGQNFVKTMLRLMKRGNSLRVVNDQTGSPTYALDLAGFIYEIIKSHLKNDEDKHTERYGVYNYSNEGFTNWYEFAVKIKALAGYDNPIQAVSTEEFPTKALRPGNSRLDKSKVKSVFSIDIPNWEEALKRCLRAIMKY